MRCAHLKVVAARRWVWESAAARLARAARRFAPNPRAVLAGSVVAQRGAQDGSALLWAYRADYTEGWRRLSRPKTAMSRSQRARPRGPRARRVMGKTCG